MGRPVAILEVGDDPLVLLVPQAISLRDHLWRADDGQYFGAK
jgi:hypothetical protein